MFIFWAKHADAAYQSDENKHHKKAAENYFGACEPTDLCMKLNQKS